MVHKYAMALWLLDLDITSVQAVVRRRDLFMEPCAVIFEYEDPMVLGTMEVQYAPKLYMRSRYYGADEFFEITGDEGQIWVTRATGEMLDLAPVMLFTGHRARAADDRVPRHRRRLGRGLRPLVATFRRLARQRDPGRHVTRVRHQGAPALLRGLSGLRDRRPRRPPHHHRLRHPDRVGRLVAQDAGEELDEVVGHLVGMRHDADVARSRRSRGTRTRGMTAAAWRAFSGGESTSCSKARTRQGTAISGHRVVRDGSVDHANAASYWPRRPGFGQPGGRP